MKQRTPMIAGNWKMYKTVPEAVQAASDIVRLVADVSGVEVMIAPTATALTSVFEIIKETPVELGAQNLHWEKEGAFTGEISGQMIRSAGCRYVIIGHSERRQYFGETDSSVNRKISAAVDAGLAPVVCIGESDAERESGKTFSVLDKQMQNGLEGLTAEQLKHAVIAYEPVWAIGTGKTATPDQAQEVHAYIRKFLGSRFDASFAESARIIYGGSVKPANISELMALSDIDGALVGGASLKPETFSEIVKYKRD